MQANPEQFHARVWLPYDRFNRTRKKAIKGILWGRRFTQVFALEEEVLVDAQFAAKVEEIAGILAAEKAALGRPLPATHFSLRHRLQITAKKNY